MRWVVTLTPYEVVYITTLATGLVVSIIVIFYYLLKSKHMRRTNVYLSGEPESVITAITPSIATLYWGFMKKFAKSLYRVLVERVHTGSLHDWFRFLSSWLSVLLIVAVIIFIIALYGVL